MTKLTDIQLILLTPASQREDGSLLPPPDGIGASAKRIRTSVAALLKHGFAEEIDVTAQGQCWRKDENRLIGLRITDAGRGWIGLEAERGETVGNPAQDDRPATHNIAAPAPTARPGTKQALVIDLLKRDLGATIIDLTEATGWLPHTTRAALTGLRKRGCTILSEKTEGVSRYRILEEAQA
jgi:hypothetical protein